MTRSAERAPGDARATKAELTEQMALLRSRVGELEQFNAELQLSNETLSGNQDHLISLVEHMPAVAFVRDFDGRFTFVNRRYEETYGVSNEDVHGKSLDEIFAEDTAQEYAEQDRRVIDEDRVIEQEIAVDFDGISHPFLSIRFPIRDSGGQTVAIGGIEQDIANRKRAEAALRENEAQFRAIIDQLPMSISLKDAEDRYLIVNRKYQDWFTEKGVPVPGKSTHDFYDDAFAERLIESDQHVRETGEVISQEIVQPFADGSMHTTQMTKFPVRLADDGSAIVGTIDIDVTGIKAMENELRQSEERFRSLVENARGIAYRYLLDDDYTMEFIGGAVEPITGYPASDFLGSQKEPVRSYASIVHPGDAESIRAEIQNAVDNNRDFTIEYRIVHRDGSPRWVHSIGAPLTDSDGKLKWIDGTLFDISETIEARRGEKLLREALDTFSDMVILYDKDERVIFTNDRYHEIYPNSPPKEEITNYTMEQLLRRSLEAGQIDQPLAKQDPEAWLQQALVKRRDSAGSQGETTHANGRTYFYRNAWTTEGGMILLQTEITERKQQEDALRRSEEQFRRILEDSPIAVAISLDDQSPDDGLVQFANARFRNMMGLSQSDIGRIRTESFHPKDSSARSQHEVALDAGQSLHNMEQIIVGKDGREIWTLMSISPIEFGKRKAALLWFYDITERKKAEEEIRRNREQLNTILESSPIGIAVTLRTTGETVYANARIADQLGFGEDRNIGQNLNDFWANQEDRERVIGRAKRSGFVEDLEVQRRRSDGSDFWALMSALPVSYEGQEALLSWTYDITERKRIEEELRESEARLRDILESSPVGFGLVSEVDNRVLFANSRFAEMFHLAHDDLNGGMADNYFAQPSVREGLVERLAADGLVQDAEIEARRADGTTFWALLTLSRTDYRGEPARLGWFYDIDERKKAGDRFRALLESAPDATVIVNADGKIVQSNQQTERLFGYAADELLDQKVEILVPDRFREGHPAHRKRFFKNAFTRPMGVGLELFGRGKGGHEFPMELSLSPIETEEGMLVSASVRDITERKQAEEALAQQKRILDVVFENMQQGVGMFDARHQLVAWNRHYQEFLGLDDALMVPDLDLMVLIEDIAARGQYGDNDKKSLIQERFAYLTDGKVGRSELVIHDQTYDVQKHPLKDGGFVITYTDITARKMAEGEVRRSREQLNSILEASPAGIVVTLRDGGKTVYANARFADQFGLGEDRNIDRDLKAFWSDPKERERVIAQAWDADFNEDVEVLRQRRDGSEFWALMSALPITYEGKDALMSWTYDITERKQGEEELRQAKQEAERALEELRKAQVQLVTTEKLASLGQLTAGIAHEIKNPLNFVNNFSETSVELLDELVEALEPVHAGLDDETREDVDDIFDTLKGDLQTINSHGKRADSIVKSMLLHARGDASERMPTGVNTLVEEALNLAYHGERARDNSFQVTLDQDLDEATGEAVLVPQEITRVLVNLLGNAFYAVKERGKASGAGSYVPTVAVRTEDKGRDVEIRVRDNGTGMPKEVRDKLFDPFFTTKPTGEGTGLGLSMSFDIIVQQHGGRIDVDSEPGAFTEFTITLPRNQSKEST